MKPGRPLSGESGDQMIAAEAQQGRLFQPSIQARFENWIQQNPGVYDLFLRFAYEAKASGRSRYGVRAIMERVRWEVSIKTEGDSLKINDHYASRLSRKLIKADPSFRGFFELRRLHRD